MERPTEIEIPEPPKGWKKFDGNLTILKIEYLRELRMFIDSGCLETSAKALFLKSAAAVCVSIEKDLKVNESSS